jgi:hypothetical protein
MSRNPQHTAKPSNQTSEKAPTEQVPDDLPGTSKGDER